VDGLFEPLYNAAGPVLDEERARAAVEGRVELDERTLGRRARVAHLLRRWRKGGSLLK
jgi:hypothetical protein